MTNTEIDDEHSESGPPPAAVTNHQDSRRRTVNREAQRDWRRRRRDYLADLEAQVRYANGQKDERTRDLEKRVQKLLRENNKLKETLRRVQSALSKSLEDESDTPAQTDVGPGSVDKGGPAKPIVHVSPEGSSDGRSIGSRNCAASDRFRPPQPLQDSRSHSGSSQLYVTASEVGLIGVAACR